MKEYLNMDSYFVGDVSINTDGQICDDKYFRGSTDIAEDYYDPICHAINSHDNLVEMNAVLIEALKSIVEINWRSTLDGLDRHTDFAERQAALNAFGKAVEIAKKTIKSIEEHK